MTIYLWGVVAGIVAVSYEWLYVTHESFWERQVLVPVLLGSWVIPLCVFKMVKGSPNLIVALVVFSFCTLSLRVAITLWLRQPVTVGTWAALGLLVLSQIARKV